MSLKVEQRLENSSFTEINPRIYTTGAYLVPMRVVVNDKSRYVWVVDEFEDDTFADGLISPNAYAQNITDLLNEE
ncbi:MAG TPA: hypothetical protein VNI84_08980 [Pyrinomonadaceae bacterium]|nr:hypothetical protein [Pyrinomonadaceae bacterium]